MRRKLESMVALLCTAALLAAATYFLSVLVRDDRERALSVELAGSPVLDEESLVFDIGGDRSRVGAKGEATLDMSRARATLEPGVLPPGLHPLVLYETYMGRRPREAVFTVLSGPFSKPGASVECGLGLAVGGGLIDPISRRVEDEVRGALNELGSLPEASLVSISTYFVDGGLDVLVEVVFREGSRINAKIPLSLAIDEEARLVAGRRAEVTASVSGTLGALAAIRGGGISRAIGSFRLDGEGGLAGALEAARRAGGEAAASEIQQQVDAWMPTLNAEMKNLLPTSVFMSLAGGTMKLDLSPCSRPVVSGRAMVFLFDARPSVFSNEGISGQDAARESRRLLPGPVMTRSIPPAPAVQSARSGLTLTLSENLINALLHYLWVEGVLEDLLGWEEWVGVLNQELSSFSALSVEGMSLDLPPVVRMEEGRLELRVGELRLEMSSGGKEFAPDLVTGLDASIALSFEGSTLRLGLVPSKLRASCSEGKVDRNVDLRRPCLSDLMVEAERRLVVHESSLEFDLPIESLMMDLPMVPAGFVSRRGAIDLLATPKN